MWKALAIKELRESLAILAVSGLATIWMLGSVMGWPFIPFSMISDVPGSIPFSNTEFAEGLLLIGGATAVGLGLKQSVWEGNGNKYYYLLHRPVAREKILVIKIIFSLTCLAIFTVGPLLIYADWAATPGNHATPFFWNMTTRSWGYCLVIPTIYLAAFFSGLRPARWFGSRLLPLVGAGMLVTLVALVRSELSSVLGIALLIILDLILVQLIMAIAQQRDY